MIPKPVGLQVASEGVVAAVGLKAAGEVPKGREEVLDVVVPKVPKVAAEGVVAATGLSTVAAGEVPVEVVEVVVASKGPDVPTS